MADFEAAAEKSQLAPPVVNMDGSGIAVGRKNQWAHARANPEFTVFNLCEKRGLEAMEAIGLLPKYKGSGVHECFAACFRRVDFRHALCGAHALRELECALEMGHKWANDLSELLEDVNVLTKGHGCALPPDLQARARWEHRKITAAALEATGGAALTRPAGQKGGRGRIAKPKHRNLQGRLIKHRGGS